MNLTWKYTPAEDSSVDPDYRLLANGGLTDLSVQDGTSYDGGFVVNEYSGEGDDFAVTTLAVRRTLAAAKRFAEAHYRALVRKPRRTSPPHISIRDVLDDNGRPVTEYRVQIGNKIVSRHYQEREAHKALATLAKTS